jgi:exodeoxyribonuclease V beta subunit
MKPFSVTEIPLRGRNLVDASAGTGKTYAIATLFIRLLLETELEPKQLLVVTFTEAATSELRDRIRARVRECLEAARAAAGSTQDSDPTLLEIIARAGDRARVVRRLREALFDFDNVEISTIHGFCQRMLMERSFQSDVTFNSQLYGDARPLIDELVLDFWATHAGPAQPELLAYMRSEGSKFSVDMARRLAYAVQRAPQVQILPAQPPTSANPDFAAFRQEWAEAREIWRRHDVVSLIAESSVRKTTYNRRHTPAWAKEVSEFFEKPPGLFLELPKHFERFCSARLLESGGQALEGHELLLACDSLFNEHQRLTRALAAEVLRFKLALIDFIATELPRRTRQRRQLSFDDLLERLYTALQSADGPELALAIRKRYPAALIDEFQDTDPLQLGIFERIYAAPSASLFLIGDPKQAIYSFRGADVFSYVAAARDTAPERHYTMTTNYRSDPSMIAAVNHLFSSCPHPFLLSDIQFQKVSPRPRAEDVLRHADGSLASGLAVLFADSGDAHNQALSSEWIRRELPMLIATDISAVLASGLSCKAEPVLPRDIAVLTRTNDQAFQIQTALRAVGVASVVLGDKSVYDSDEARDLERLLGAVVEPTSMRLLRAALTTELIGVGASALCEMDESEGQWESWISAFHEYNGIWSHTGFVQMMRVLMARSRVQERLLTFGDGERRMTNLLQLIELLHAASVERHLGPSGLFTFLTQQRRRDAIGMEAESAQIRLESDADAVKITTMHKSKGLEYPVVYCPYLWHGMLLHQSDEQAPKLHTETGQLVLDIGSEDQKEHLTRARWEQFAENLRLLYVALTRARHRCTVVWGRIGKFSTSALGYLLHPPSDTGAAADVATIQAHLASLSQAAMLADLEKHAASAPIVIYKAAEQPPLLAPPEAQAAELPGQARRSTRRIDDRFRTSSFSALTSHAPLPLGSEAHVRDHDETSALGRLAPVPVEPEAKLRLADFPRGTQAGSFFHDVLEHYDFASPRPNVLPKMVEARLTSYRYPVETWRDRVCEQVYAVLDTPLTQNPDHKPFCLGEITLAERLSELEFCLPVANAGPTLDNAALNSADLARIFRQYPSQVLSAEYADAVGRLGFVPLRGFLRGFIDLVFRHDGCYYLVDYKANHLGVHASDYGPEALGNAMSRGQYFLQYHLYALALHRYLKQRVPAYEFARHFGGVLYLFVKGMGPELGSSGVFFEKPPIERLEALSRLLDRPGGQT